MRNKKRKMSDTFLKITLLDDGKVEILGSVGENVENPLSLVGLLHDINTGFHSNNMFEILFKAADASKKNDHFMNDLTLGWQLIQEKFKKEQNRELPIVKPTEVFKKMQNNMGVL